MTRQAYPSAEPSDTGSATTSAAKTRRPHRKSRNGCSECKRRHIRCDERQPVCGNCDVGERTCFFPAPKAAKLNEAQRHRQHRPRQRLEAKASPTPGSDMSNQSITSEVDADNQHSLALRQHRNHTEIGQTPGQPSLRSLLGSWAPVPDLSPLPPALPFSPSPVQLGDNCYHPGFTGVPDATFKPIYTAQDMILLHHARTVPNITGPKHCAVDVAIRRVVDSPYLLDEVLAFTAFHMAYLYPGSAVNLQHVATELQTRAIASFTRVTEAVPRDDVFTAVPRFLFSAILGRHCFADTLTYYRADFNVFIDRFVECLNINRGIRTVIPPARSYLHLSEMQPFLNVILEAESKVTSSGSECDPLRRMMDDSDLRQESKMGCHQAIGALQDSFDLCHHVGEVDYPQCASVFSARVDAVFIEVLRKHRPEALVILAYYGVLLHRCRGFWAFGNAGAAVIRMIAGQLSSYWQESLAWPLHVLEVEPAEEVPRCATTPSGSQI